ncbi:MAG: hypothetical protein ACM3NF_11410 [Gemmatimonadota bacterium]
MRHRRFLRPRPLLALLIAIAPLLLGACASKKANLAWQPGDTIICPHCGREFAVPEKLGK